MNETVLVRYGEIGLKSQPVRKKFENILLQNIKSAISNISHRFRTERGRIFIDTRETEEVARRVANLPGIVSASPTLTTNATSTAISELGVDIAEESFTPGDTFAVRVRRVGNHKFTSKDIAELVGSRILDTMPRLKVDLDSPDRELYIEIRRENAYLFTKVVGGVGGLPVGSQGKVLVLLSEKIKGMVTTFSILKRGSLACPLFFECRETPEAELSSITEKLQKFHPDIELRTISMAPAIEEIQKKVPFEIQSLLKERLKMNISESVARRVNAKVLASDFNLQELASLSLHNLNFIEKKTYFPVLYPLTGFENEDIIEFGRKIDLELSEEELEANLRRYPEVKRADLEEIRKAESKIPEDSLVESSLQSLEVYT